MDTRRYAYLLVQYSTVILDNPILVSYLSSMSNFQPKNVLAIGYSLSISLHSNFELCETHTHTLKIFVFSINPYFQKEKALHQSRPCNDGLTSVHDGKWVDPL